MAPTSRRLACPRHWGLPPTRPCCGCQRASDHHRHALPWRHRHGVGCFRVRARRPSDAVAEAGCFRRGFAQADYKLMSVAWVGLGEGIPSRIEAYPEWMEPSECAADLQRRVVGRRVQPITLSQTCARPGRAGRGACTVFPNRLHRCITCVLGSLM